MKKATLLIAVVVVGVLLASAAVTTKGALFASASTTVHENIFDEVYLLNLKRRPDRLMNFMNHYVKSDIADVSVMKVDAVDGSTLDIDKVPLTDLARAELKEIENTGFRSKHYQLTKGAIGCYLSHVKIWQHVLLNGHQVALVFEDDAHIPPNFAYFLNKAIVQVPLDWDIVLLGYICNKCESHTTYNEVNRFMLTHAYLITSKAIERIIATKSLFPITQQIDAYLSELSDVLNIYTVKKSIVPQFKSRTDIQAPIRKSATDTYSRMRIDRQVK